VDERAACACGVYAFGRCVECSTPLCGEHANRIESVGIFCRRHHDAWWVGEKARRSDLAKENAQLLAAFLREAAGRLKASGKPTVSGTDGTRSWEGWLIGEGTGPAPPEKWDTSYAPPRGPRERYVLTADGGLVTQRWDRTEVRAAGFMRSAKFAEGWGYCSVTSNDQVAGSSVEVIMGGTYRQQDIDRIRKLLDGDAPALVLRETGLTESAPGRVLVVSERVGSAVSM
jgi:hypothetical protein